ncbi:hypothetical protein KQI84_18925 [bacterium]|nr:hypothetical protein [bacterium]
MTSTKRNSVVRALIIAVLMIPLALVAQITISGSTFEPAGSSAGGTLSLGSVVGQPEASTPSTASTLSLFHGFYYPGFGSPLYVNLLNFEAVNKGNGVSPLLQWNTAAEVSNVGFNVYTGELVGGTWFPGEKLNTTMIPAEGGPTSGADYSFTDPNVYIYGSGVRAYFLEDVDLSGGSTYNGPAYLEVGAEAVGKEFWTIF